MSKSSKSRTKIRKIMAAKAKHACTFGRSRATGKCRKGPKKYKKKGRRVRRKRKVRRVKRKCKNGRSRATGRCRKRRKRRKPACRFGRSRATGKCRKRRIKSKRHLIRNKRRCKYGRRPTGKCSRKGERRHIARSFKGATGKRARGCKHGRLSSGKCRAKKLKGKRRRSPKQRAAGRRGSSGLRLWIRVLKSNGYMKKGAAFKPLPKKGSAEYRHARAQYDRLKGGSSGAKAASKPRRSGRKRKARKNYGR